MKNIIEELLNNYEIIIENNEYINHSLIDIPVYVINLDKDKYRRGYIKFIMNKMKINYNLIIVKTIKEETRVLFNKDKNNDKDTTNGVIGCFLSHLWCIKHAINEKKKDYFLILEDDIVFNKKANMTKLCPKCYQYFVKILFYKR